MRERRRNHRFNLQGKVHLHLGNRHYELPAADISVSGIGIMLDVALFGTKPAGEVGICTIEADDLASPVEAYVSVMNIRRIGQQYLIGLRFESISDDQLRVVRAYESLVKARRLRLRRAGDPA